MENFSKNLVYFLDRRKHTMEQNLRLVVIGLLIVLLIGMFQPLMGVDFSFSLKTGDTGIDKASNVEVPILDPKTNFFEFNIGDMVTQKPLRDYKIFGIPIGSIEVLGINLYDLAKTPFPDLSGLSNIENLLKGDWVNFLTSDTYKDFCQNTLGQFGLGDLGQALLNVSNVVVDLTKQASSTISQVTVILNELSKAVSTLNSSVSAAEGVVSTINTVFLIWVLIILLCVLLFCIKKGPRFLPAIIMTIFTVIFLAVGIGILIVNGILGSAINEAMTSLNDGLRDTLLTQIPAASAITAFVSIDQINFVLSFAIVAGLGWWLITVPLLGMTIIMYFIPKYKKNHPEIAEKWAKVPEFIDPAISEQSSDSSSQKADSVVATKEVKAENKTENTEKLTKTASDNNKDEKKPKAAAKTSTKKASGTSKKSSGAPKSNSKSSNSGQTINKSNNKTSTKQKPKQNTKKD